MDGDKRRLMKKQRVLIYKEVGQKDVDRHERRLI